MTVAPSRRATSVASAVNASIGSATSMRGAATAARAQHRDGALLDRGLREVVPVDVLAGHGEEQPTRADLARVVFDGAGHDGVRVGVAQLAVDGRGDLGQGQRDHRATPRQRRAQHVAVVEGVRDAGDLLAGLVALAGDQHGVAGPGARDGGGDRLGPVADLAHLAALGRRHRVDAGEHRCADRRRVLGARVVVGDDQQVGAACGDLAHVRPLAAVAVAAAAQHDDQPSRGERTQRAQGTVDGGRLVAVVDDREEVLAGVDALHPARHGRRRDRRARRPRPAPSSRAGSPAPAARWRRCSGPGTAQPVTRSTPGPVHAEPGRAVARSR